MTNEIDFKDIENEKENFRSWGWPEREVFVGERRISFFEMPAGPEGSLKNFAFQYTTGISGDKYLIGVSEEIPKDFQSFWALHEYVEYVELPGVKGNCRMALDEELRFVPDVITGEYIPMRAKFFRDLVEYVKSKPEKYSSSKVSEFSASRDRLNDLEGNIK
jgi:hypothetical protein